MFKKKSQHCDRSFSTPLHMKSSTVDWFQWKWFCTIDWYKWLQRLNETEPLTYRRQICSHKSIMFDKLSQYYRKVQEWKYWISKNRLKKKKKKKKETNLGKKEAKTRFLLGSTVFILKIISNYINKLDEISAKLASIIWLDFDPTKLITLIKSFGLLIIDLLKLHSELYQ